MAKKLLEKNLPLEEIIEVTELFLIIYFIFSLKMNSL